MSNNSLLRFARYSLILFSLSVMYNCKSDSSSTNQETPSKVIDSKPASEAKSDVSDAVESLREFGRLHSLDIKVDQLRAYPKSMTEMMVYSKVAGFPVKSKFMPYDYIRLKLKEPLISVWLDGGYFVIKSVEEDHVQLYIPKQGNVKMERQEFVKKWAIKVDDNDQYGNVIILK